MADFESLLGNSTALYIENPANIEYLSGFRGTSGYVLLTLAHTYLITDARYFFEAQKNLSKKNLNLKIINSGSHALETLATILRRHHIRKLGFEAQNISYQKWQELKILTKKKTPRLKLFPTKHLIEKIRSIKNAAEIQHIKAAQKITDTVFKKITPYLKIGVTEAKIAWQIEKIGRDLGAEKVAFSPLVCFGPSSATPHHQPNQTKLQKGSPILLDFGFVKNAYHSDMTRTLFTQTPTSLQKKVYQTVLKAQENAIQNIKPGFSGQKADFLGRSIIKQAGFGDYFTHSLGHGVGLEIHELPNLSPKSKNKPIITLATNMVITIEPGIYLNNQFGVRLEDMILIGEKNNLNLTHSKKGLSEAIMKL